LFNILGALLQSDEFVETAETPQPSHLLVVQLVVELRLVLYGEDGRVAYLGIQLLGDEGVRILDELLGTGLALLGRV
jgi:hypothetical protein